MDDSLDTVAQAARLALENRAALSAAPAQPTSAPAAAAPSPALVAHVLRERFSNTRRSDNIVDARK